MKLPQFNLLATASYWSQYKIDILHTTRSSFINNLHQNVTIIFLCQLSISHYLYLENCLLSPAAFFPYGLSAENAWPDDPKSFLPPCWPCWDPSTRRAWLVRLVGAFLSPLALRLRSIRGGTWNPNALPTPVKIKIKIRINTTKNHKKCRECI